MTRVDPPTRGDERTQLLAYLEYQRQTLRQKAGGLDAGQLATALPPSDMTLGGMVKHLAPVEPPHLTHLLDSGADSDRYVRCVAPAGLSAGRRTRGGSR